MSENTMQVEKICVPEEQTMTILATLALQSTQFEKESTHQDKLDLQFFVASPDHELLSAIDENEAIVGYLAYSTTRGAGFGFRGQFATVLARNDTARAALVNKAIEGAKEKGDDRIYFQIDQLESIDWHLANGAIDMSGAKVVPEWDDSIEIFESEMTFRYDVLSAQKTTEINRQSLPDGHSIELFDKYDEVTARQIAGLMPQLDPTFSPELTTERVENYKYMINSNNYKIMVVRDETGSAVGTLSLTRTDSDTWQLEDVILDTRQRGKGLGKAMMQCMVDWAYSDGIAQILLQTEAHRESAVGLYFGTGAKMLRDTKTLKYHVPQAD